MRCEIEFFRMTKEAPEGVVVRRVSVDFNDLQAAKNYGLSNTGVANSPDEVDDGFNVRIRSVVRSTVYIRQEDRAVKAP
jgi:hypothetical protein